MEKKLLLNELAIIGINMLATNHSYNSKPNEILHLFLLKDLNFISKFWNKLNDQCKTLVLKYHDKEIFELMANSGEKDE
jgi:hypothetical protein